MRVAMRISILALAILFIAGSAHSSERANIRGMGMARTYVVSSRGLDAVGSNPANLARQDGRTVTLSLPSLGAHLGSDVIDYDLYTRYLTGEATDSGRAGRYLSDADKKAILSGFGDDRGITVVTVDARLVGLKVSVDSIGSFAFTVTDHAAAAAKIPEDYVKFILYGNPAGSQYEFGKTDVRGAWTREYALSFAGVLPAPEGIEWLAGGITAKLVHGYAYFEIERFNTSLSTAYNGILTGTVDVLSRQSTSDMFDKDGGSSFSPLPTPAGRGIGFDVGVAGGINKFLTVGVSITDIGSIRWSGNVTEYSADTSFAMEDPLDPDNRDNLENLVSGRKRDGANFSSQLPTTIHVGLGVEVHKIPALKEMPGELDVEADYHQSIREAPAQFMNARFSLGLEYRLVKWFPIRSGLSLGGTDHLNYSLGFGFRTGYFDIDFATENIEWLVSRAHSSYGSIAVGIAVGL
jgi:hypothetical protein